MNAESGDRARSVIVAAACVGCMWCNVCWCAELGGRYCVVSAASCDKAVAAGVSGTSQSAAGGPCCMIVVKQQKKVDHTLRMVFMDMMAFIGTCIYGLYWDMYNIFSVM